MNYYFLLEDEKSFLKTLPIWLETLEFKCTRVPDIKAVDKNNYILQSGRGVTQLVTKILFDTINTIRDNPNTIDKLVIILDTEQETEEYRKQQVFSEIEKEYDVSMFDFEIVILVCNHCFESWLLGREGLYPENIVETDSDFYPYYKHYHIGVQDPEKMGVPLGCNETIAKYHFHYLCEAFRYKKIRYSKNNPKAVACSDYLNGMLRRIERTEHLSSFKAFIQFIINENHFI